MPQPQLTEKTRVFQDPLQEAKIKCPDRLSPYHATVISLICCRIRTEARGTAGGGVNHQPQDHSVLPQATLRRAAMDINQVFQSLPL